MSDIKTSVQIGTVTITVTEKKDEKKEAEKK